MRWHDNTRYVFNTVHTRRTSFSFSVRRNSLSKKRLRARRVNGERKSSLAPSVKSLIRYTIRLRNTFGFAHARGDDRIDGTVRGEGSGDTRADAF